ncbi:MAG: Sensor histidine kinase RcsC [Phycisphaerae bacterium]|nr:Sensor histidine kinase RcsC [Phycisphaerae bacterium]
MSIQYRFILIIGIVTGLLMVTLAVVERWVVEEHFSELEQQWMRHNLAQMKHGMAVVQQELDDYAREWAWWSDMYEYVDRRNVQFESSNFSPTMLANLKLNLLAVLDIENQVIFSCAVDSFSQRHATIPDETWQILQTSLPNYVAPRSNKPFSGILSLKQGPMFISAYPILTSERQGPPRGTLIFGRPINDRIAERLSDMLNMKVEISDWGKQNDFAPLGSEAMETSPKQFNDTRIETTSQSLIGNLILRDESGQPALRLRQQSNRTVYQYGLATVNHLIWSLTGVVILMTCLTYYLVDRQIVSRVKSLIDQVHELHATTQDRNAIVIPGQDELGMLALEINRMLDRNTLTQQLLQDAVDESQRLIQSVETANTHKSQFLANMSHEIRTPMTAILGYLDLLGDGCAQTCQFGEQHTQKYVQIMRRNGTHLLELINQILDLSRIEAGQLEFDWQSHHPSRLLQEIVEIVQDQAQKKNIALTVEDQAPADLYWKWIPCACARYCLIS